MLLLWQRFNSRNVYCIQRHCQNDLSLSELMIEIKFYTTKAASCYSILLPQWNRLSSIWMSEKFEMPWGRINHDAYCTNRIRDSPLTAELLYKSLLASVTPPLYMPRASAVSFMSTVIFTWMERGLHNTCRWLHVFESVHLHVYHVSACICTSPSICLHRAHQVLLV